MLGRKRRRSHPRSLESRVLQQPACEVAGRIVKNRPRVGQPARLARSPLGLELRHTRAQLFTVARLELEIHSRDHEAKRQIGAAIGKLDLGATERERLTLLIDAWHQ